MDLAKVDVELAAEQLLDDSSILAVVGPEYSSHVFRVAPRFVRAHKPLITPAATAEHISRAFAGLSAASVVLVHNHPSGDPTASDQDIRFTREVARAGQVLGIELVDHIIVAEGGFTSFAAEGLIPCASSRTLEGGLS